MTSQLPDSREYLVGSIVVGEGLRQGYRGREVISHLSLTIGPGVLGLVGPNGAGKSTLLNVLATVMPPQGGRLSIFGSALTSEKDVRLARRQIGYLPQDFGFFPNFSVYDFVRYCAWIREVPRKSAHAETVTAIARVGLESRSSSKLKSLSGGMLRRAGIATAIVGSPRLVLLDEPTVGLDPAQRLDFRSLVRSLRDERAVILSTHLVEDISAVCDLVGVMSEGDIKFMGTPAELAARARLGTAGDSDLERGYVSVIASAPAEAAA